MLRSLLIYLSQATWACNFVTKWSFAKKAASRFVAGEQLEDGIEVVKRLNSKGINATLDHLGEHTTTPEIARKAADEIIEIIDAIAESGVRANISIKLTQIGLSLDTVLCEDNLRRILTYAKSKHNFVRIDMEDSPWTKITLDLFVKMKSDFHLTNSGVVIQSYLYRSEKDVRNIIDMGGKVRLCKGAYKEPPEVAFPKKSDVDKNFDLLSKILIDCVKAQGSPRICDDGKFPPILAVASHDPDRLQYAKEYAKKMNIPKQALEFQMLYGIRRDLQDRLVSEGYPIRVYVPFGEEWYAYYVRRLAERPANLWFFISNFFRK
jgi:proline dehydrogenase